MKQVFKVYYSNKLWTAFTFSFLLLFWACKRDNTPTPGNEEGNEITSGKYTYKLQESITGLTIWTQPCTKKVKSSDNAPETVMSGVKICAAKNEFEPFQIVLDKGSGTVTVKIDEFQGLGSGQRLEINQAGFESGWAEPLTSIDNGGNVTLSSSECIPIWFTVYVPADAQSGSHNTTLELTIGDNKIEIPVELYVFNFALPDDIHFATQFNKSMSGESSHTEMFEHRLTPKSPTWPSGFSYDITWPSPYTTFYDEADQDPQYGIKYLAAKYLKGEGWKGNGYPNGMAFQFVDNDTPRPSMFAGISIGSNQYGTTTYNDEWKKFLSALNTYLVNNSYQDKVYYYVMNEPEDVADYNLAAYLARMCKEAAPNLRIAISEEPKAEIAENSTYGTCTYDIWMASLQHFEEDYAKTRMKKGEQVWLYSLPQDPDPFFNPTVVNKQGIHQRIIPWVSWACRTRGWAYYDGGSFYDNNRPNIRMELLREGIEDYEYLFLANNSQYPEPDQTCNIDATVSSVATDLTNWNKDADALMDLKWRLGFYIEDNGVSTPPVLEIQANRERGEYYINFQDVDGQPTIAPLVVDGKTYMKIGWEAYNTNNYYGWSGSAVGVENRTKSGYTDVSGFTEIEKSYIYDDYGHINTFEFDLENGNYEVTVGVGRPNIVTGDATNVVIEGVKFYDAVTGIPSSDSETKTITVSDGSLSLTMGTIINSQGQYTFLAYLKIVPVD